MKLMPKTVRRNGGSTPLCTARERVRDSWKVLKQSLYYFSSNSKAKGAPDVADDKTNSSSEVSHPFAFDICHSNDGEADSAQEEYDDSVESVIMRNVDTLISDSEDFDEINELLEAYKHELKAYNRIKKSVSDNVFCSDVSEISSISDLSLSSDSENGSQITITSGCGRRTPDLFDGSLENPSPNLPVFTGIHKESNLTHRLASTSGKSFSSSSTLSATQSPEIEIVRELHIPPPERAKAIFKPLPSLMKPSFIPNLSSFDDGGLDTDSSIATPYFEDIVVSGNSGDKDDATSCIIQNHVMSEKTVEKVSPSVSFNEPILPAYPNGYVSLESNKDNFCSCANSGPDQISPQLNPNNNGEVADEENCEELKLFGEAAPSEHQLKPMLISTGPNISTKSNLYSDSSFDSETFLTKSSLSRSPNIADEAESRKVSMPLDEKYLQNNLGGSGDESDSVSVIDENYFIVHPEVKGEISCGNPRCPNQSIRVSNESLKYTSCPSCFVCYCSRACRHKHWPDHKETCLVGFVNFYVHCFFRRCEKDCNINLYLGNLARQAYLVFGRGCLMISFETPMDIKNDALSTTSSLSTQPVYKDIEKVVSENRLNRHLHMLCQNIKDYDPDQEFVLNIFVWIGNPEPELKLCTAVVRSARISSLHMENPDYGEAILSYSIRKFSLPSFLPTMHSDTETRRYYCKEVAFGLKRYGVHLKSEYPEAYEKLYRYIDQELLFAPIVLYGKRNDRNYKCILHSGRLKQLQDFCGEGTFV